MRISGGQDRNKQSPNPNNHHHLTTTHPQNKRRQLFLEAAPTGVEAWYRDRHGFETVDAVRMEFRRGGFDLPLMLRRPRGGSGDSGGGGGDGDAATTSSE